MWLPVTKILIKQIKIICISPLTCLCCGLSLGILALLAAVVAVKVGDKSQTLLYTVSYFLSYKFGTCIIIHMFLIFDSCDVASVTKRLIEQIETINISFIINSIHI